MDAKELERLYEQLLKMDASAEQIMRATLVASVRYLQENEQRTLSKIQKIVEDELVRLWEEKRRIQQQCDHLIVDSTQQAGPVDSIATTERCRICGAEF